MGDEKLFTLQWYSFFGLGITWRFTKRGLANDQGTVIRCEINFNIPFVLVPFVWEVSNENSA